MLADEFGGVFAPANLSVLTHLAPERWSGVGVAAGKSVSVRALAYVMAGHARHHLGILRARYGIVA